MKKLFLALTAVVSLTLLAACSQTTSTPTATINYSAAASLKPALTAIYTKYHQDHPSLTVNFDYEGSGTIVQKVQSGAPIDGVFLASQADATTLSTANKILDTHKTLGNSLVAIVPKKSSATSTDLSALVKQAQKIAIGAPTTVPAGSYAVESLKTLNLYNAAQQKLVQASDVTQALSYVAAGNADLGFVYKTDALTNKDVKVAFAVPDATHSPIVYVTGLVTGSKNSNAVKSFNAYLVSKEAQTIFKQYGFTNPK